jgi:manganese transport protein
MISLNKRISDFIKALGPGIITGALVLGPGTLTVTSKLGSLYQYKMLWVIAISILFMIVFTIISARYGFYNKVSLIETIKTRYGKWVAYLVGISIFIVAISFQAGNSIGAGLALSAIIDADPVPWIILCSMTAMATLFFRSFYKILEKIMIAIGADHVELISDHGYHF